MQLKIFFFFKNFDFYCDHLNVLYNLQGDFYQAKIIYSKAIHRHPENAALWRHLAHLLLMMEPTSQCLRNKNIALGATVASSAAIAITQVSKCNSNITQVGKICVMQTYKMLSIKI